MNRKLKKVNILECFLKDYVALKTGENADENSAGASLK